MSQINWIKSFCSILGVDFIFSALHKFGYRDKFIHMFQVAHTNIESKLKINGLLSDPLNPMCVCQGCLLLHADMQYSGWGTC